MSQTTFMLPMSKVFNRIGREATLQKLPAVDQAIILAHVAREFKLWSEHAGFIRQIIAYRKSQQTPSPASMGKLIEEEPRQFQEDMRLAEAETRRFGNGDFTASQRDKYLHGRVKLGMEIFRLSCFRPYYSQFALQYQLGSDAAISQLAQLASSTDASAFLTAAHSSKNLTESERMVVYIAVLTDLLTLCEKACLHKQIETLPEGERRGHVFVPALAHLIRMAAEYSDPKNMPAGYTVDRAQEEIRAKSAYITTLAGWDYAERTTLYAIDLCISTGDYDQGIKIAQAREMAGQLAILKELKRFTGPDFVELPES